MPKAKAATVYETRPRVVDSMAPNGMEIIRFDGWARAAHWAHVLSFFALLVTGLAIFGPQGDTIARVFGGIQATRLIHRAAAVTFMALSIVLLLISAANNRFRNIFQGLKNLLAFDKDDLAFLNEFPKKFFGLEARVPEQGKFNGGQKINSILVVFGSIVLAATGLVLWNPKAFPIYLVRLAYPLHDGAMFIMFALVLGHMYLSLVHPITRKALGAMWHGRMSGEYAEHYHAKWYRAAVEKTALEKTDTAKSGKTTSV
ncbi:MAG: cytochrome b/b6 domain-containing protein [Firmicutes bacterium]|nr:cytochrome b/b6 domain-containing protein [Bacillota bacterium]